MKPIELSRANVKKMLSPRALDVHKGQNGKLLVVGGSWLYYGSPALVARAAYRAGADLVYLLVPERIAHTVASYSPDFIVWGYEGDTLSEKAFELFDELSEKTDALVIGNGLLKDATVLKTAAALVARWKKPLVIDADCIGRVWKQGALYTPHVVEFERMSGERPSENLEERCAQVRKEADIRGGSVVLKGAIDVVSNGKKCALNKTGNAGMTCGGTGDTLAGVAGAMLAAGHGAFESACLAAYLNGLAGDTAFEELGYSLMASDLIEKLPAAIHLLRA